MKPRAWVCSSLALLAVLWLALPAAAQVQKLTQAAFVLDAADTPPSDSADWKPVTLPDAWWRSRPGVAGSGWYRLTWTLDRPPSAPQALYLAKLGRIGEAWVNGRLVGSTGSPERPDLIQRPLLFALDGAALHAGSNTLHLRMRTDPLYSGVATEVQAGDAAVLQTAYRWRWFATVTGAQLQFGAALVLAVFMLVLAVKRPRERTFAWFGVASVMYCLFLLDWVLLVAPMSWVDWQAVRGFALQGINMGTLMFALRYGGWRWPRVEPFLWATVPLVALAYGLEARGIELPVDVGWLQYASIAAYIGVFGAVAWRRRSLESVALLVASPGCFLDGIFGTPPEGVSLFPYSFLILFVLMGAILVNRFARSLGEAEQLNAELEQRVQAKHAELETQYTRTRALEQQQAVLAERARLMSDMHDGIGGQLISTLTLVEHGEASKEQVTAALRECIDDLRLAIDSLQPAGDDLLPLLGNLRYRLEPRLRAQGIALEWQVQDVPKLACLTPQNVLHVLRILQEAFTNVMKHAAARHIRVATRVEAEGVAIEVSDDGRGFSGEACADGRGLANMRRRAQVLGGRLSVLPSPAGTTLSLQLPRG